MERDQILHIQAFDIMQRVERFRKRAFEDSRQKRDAA